MLTEPSILFCGGQEMMIVVILNMIEPNKTAIGKGSIFHLSYIATHS